MKPDNAAVGNLDNAVVRGFAWTAGAKWATQLITWTSVFVTARLVSPLDFGLLDMASFFVAVTGIAAEFGICNAVLQMHELDRRVFAQLHTVSMALATLAFGSCILAAPWLADFFHARELKVLVVVDGVTFLITGYYSVSLGLLQKDMDYRRMSLSEAVGAIGQAVVTVAGAAMHFAYWAIMAGILVNRTTVALLTVYWKPVGFAVPRLKDLLAPLRLGRHVMVSRLAAVAFAQVDGVLVARTMGGATVGAYRFALNLAAAPSQKIGALFMRVTGPLFANVQTDKAQVRRYYLIFTDVLAVAVGPLALGCAVLAPDLVALLLGRQWAQAAAPLRWLAVYGFLKNLDNLTDQVLNSLRRTRFLMWMALFTTAVMTPAFIVALRWGPGAVAASWLILTPLTLAPPAIVLFRAIRLPLRDYLATLGPAVCGIAGMIAGILLVAAPLPKNWPVILRLAIQIAAGGAIYSGILLTVYRERMLRYLRFFRQLRRGIPLTPETAASGGA
jgi:PST family polysaccharide transporter